METIAILGGGSWGTALALLLARNHPTLPFSLWVHDSKLASTMRERRVNEVYLPDFKLPETIRVTSDLAEAAAGATVLVGVMPSAYAREVYAAALRNLAEMPVFISATKGLETGTLNRMSQVIEEVGAARFQKPARAAALSGPSFALEVARGDPVAVVAASRDRSLAQQAQEIFSGPTLRVYTSEDVVGVEIGGAVKNIIAIAAGICIGVGLGHSTIASLITRGAAEMTRLACALGAEPRTLAGLSGVGDLVLTATGPLSRNRAVGVELGRGRTLVDILQSMRMVAEGIGTTAAAVELARRVGVEIPITEQMHAVLYQGRAPHEAIRELMQRKLKEE
jgi:glycerol-3-phosphate dehydrogenase (NAD(P)+)